MTLSDLQFLIQEKLDIHRCNGDCTKRIIELVKKRDELLFEKIKECEFEGNVTIDDIKKLL